jgi:methylated-DNA-[protein]-cysteine S-methyltransferase
MVGKDKPMTTASNPQRTDDALAAWLGDARGRRAEAEHEPLLGALDALFEAGPGPQAVRAAQARLRQAREAEGLWYSWTASPVGRVFFAATGQGLAAVDFGMTEREFRQRLQARYGREAVRAPERLGRFSRQLSEYFAGRRAVFDLPLDLARVPEFQRRVLLAALQIPRGEVTTYGEIARRIGHPRSSRAVGQALGHNPIPIVIPCHRVVGSDGSLRGYGSGRGIESKAQLLRLEGARR